MPKDARQAIELDDDDDRRLYAVSSRSDKRLIVTATTRRWAEPMYVELRPARVRELIDFLSQTVELQPSDR